MNAAEKYELAIRQADDAYDVALEEAQEDYERAKSEASAVFKVAKKQAVIDRKHAYKLAEAAYERHNQARYKREDAEAAADYIAAACQ